jgi:hypothetical protein
MWNGYPSTSLASAEPGSVQPNWDEEMKPKPWFSVYDGTVHQLDGSRSFTNGVTVGGVNNWIQER